MDLPKSGSIEAFAMLVDINGFGRLVNSDFPGIAQFVSDVMIGGVQQVQRFNGEVVGFAGDQFYALLDTAENVFAVCAGIAKDMRRQYEFFEHVDERFVSDSRKFGLKIGIEYGHLDIGHISSNFLGKQYIYTGLPPTYAARIMSSKKPKGNKIVYGPKAYEMGMDQWASEGPFFTKGKRGENKYEYYSLSLDEVWEPNQ